MQNEVQAMLAFWHQHLLELHGVALSQEHLIIFNMSSGARGTLSGTVVGVRDVEPSSLVHQNQNQNQNNLYSTHVVAVNKILLYSVVYMYVVYRNSI